MINTAYQFFLDNFFSGDIPVALQGIAEELACLFAVGSVLFVVVTVLSLVVFFFHYITGLGLRRR